MPTILMCSPAHIRIENEINDWMDDSRQPDAKLAVKHWNDLVSVYKSLGVEIEYIRPHPDFQDMCFTANGGFFFDGKFILSRFGKKAQKTRQGEIGLYANMFWERTKMVHPEVYTVPKTISYEGQGDTVLVPRNGRRAGERRDSFLFFGHGQGRTCKRAGKVLEKILDIEAIPLKLVNPKFYHLDTAMVFLSPNILMYYPPAFRKESARTIKRVAKNRNLVLLPVGARDAYNFVCNAVHIRRTIVTQKMSAGLRRKLARLGIKSVKEIEMTETRKNGGAVRCLTLFLSREFD